MDEEQIAIEIIALWLSGASAETTVAKIDAIALKYIIMARIGKIITDMPESEEE